MSIIGNNLGMMADMMESCTMMDEVSTGDGGIFETKEIYRPGATFRAVIVKRGSTEKQIAEAQGTAEIYDVVVEADMRIMKYQKVFRRDSDGVTFRITSNPVAAPGISTVQIASMTAERWDIPYDKRSQGD